MKVNTVGLLMADLNGLIHVFGQTFIAKWKVLALI